jgi:PIN domain nuclease of toxin-antitoxin system
LGRSLVSPSHLLDTATLIWAIDEPRKLSRLARKICSEGDPAVSIISLMEMIVKAQKGKLGLVPDPVSWWNKNVRELGYSVLPLRQNHVEQLWALPPIHRDPADRLLIAQAIVERIPIVSCDGVIGQYSVTVVW